ncbi:MAG TPA: response regulator [Accumulibacter sp.]|uniref:response regulator n=1 Tax=Accumulibacter sp. TaxID=2053492 RepID=UPI000EC4D5E5|nr:response regulator [Accumulibacter sp.]HCZ14354.1 two-component system response regulator KdpE [Accumulibacter sp.]HRF72360.1 response regulator [Accumulibacter sp.]
MSETTTRVIVVEDEPQIRRFVCDALRREACAAIEAATARQGLDEAADGKADLVILDLGLPDMNGIDFIRDLRTWSSVPILILSARSAEHDKIAALDTGADDYLAKPFGVGELLARVRALLRRHWHGEAKPHHQFGEVEVHLSRRIVSRGGAEIHLTQIEYRLLAVMLANSGKVLTHRYLIHEVWGPGYADQAHYLRIYVGRLRQKLEKDPTQPQHILTETGVGYRFQS